jgi:hypothetical protein
MLGPLIHVHVLAIPGVHANDAGFITDLSRVVGWSAKRFSPVGCETLRMLRMIAVRKRVSGSAGASETT